MVCQKGRRTATDKLGINYANIGRSEFDIEARKKTIPEVCEINLTEIQLPLD